MAGGYLPFLALYVVPRTLELAWPQAVTSLAVLPLALVPLTFAYAILRYKLWDIGAIVRDTVTLSLTVLVGVIGFSLANLVINRAVPDEMALARTLVSFVSGLVIAGLLIPTRKGIGASLERLQYRDSFSKRRASSCSVPGETSLAAMVLTSASARIDSRSASDISTNCPTAIRPA